MSFKLNENFIKAIPKTDLHVHLDGSLRISTLIDLGKKLKVKLPSFTEEGLNELVFKKYYNDLVEYLHGFKYTCAVMQDAEALEQIAYELAVDSFSEGVRYIEPRFAPQLHFKTEMDLPVILSAVDLGLNRAKKEFNNNPEIEAGNEPGYDYGIIVCAMRMFTPGFSKYHEELLRVHNYSPPRSTYAMASLELARAAVDIRDKHGINIVAFDLAGQENGYPAHDHVNAYRFAHRNFMHKTVHAGESYGAESIFDAITELHADRIGHGYYLFDTGRINSAIEDKNAYIKSLAEYIADRRVTLEICLTSNLQTNPSLEKLEDHPWRKMAETKISTVFCTDNRLISNTTVCDEIGLAVKHLNMTEYELKSSIINSFKRSFMPITYIEKRNYVRENNYLL